MSSSRRPRVAIVHPQLREVAGSETTAAWLAEALREDYEVTLAAMGPYDLEHLNAVYGTRLTPDTVHTISLPPLRWAQGRLAALRTFPLCRWAKKISGDYDVMISTYNVMDFGRPGIQFLADFSFDDDLRRSLSPQASGMKGLAYRRSPARSMYLWLGRRLSAQTGQGWLRNRTYANSEWSRGVMERRFGIPCEVVYPPVQDIPMGLAWADRENGFVVPARVSREKRLEKIIEIIAEVRKRGRDVHLHILGREEPGSYAREIHALCDRHGGWAHFEGLVVGEKKQGFLSRHRYGISACQNEAFGIAVAESVKAGAIVWVPDGGGQTEIVDHDALVYSSTEAAVSKILRVLESDPQRLELSRHLERRAALFSIDRYIAETRRVVHGYLEKSKESRAE